MGHGRTPLTPMAAVTAASTSGPSGLYCSGAVVGPATRPNPNDSLTSCLAWGVGERRRGGIRDREQKVAA